MSDDPFTEHLSQFTPAASLDRDALLFAAGRASARPFRRWKIAAGVLAAGQLLMLTFILCTRPGTSLPGSASGPPAMVAVEPPPRFPVVPPEVWTVRDASLFTDGKWPIQEFFDSSAPPDWPLRAYDPPPLDLLQ